MIAAELYTLRDHLQDADAIAASLQRVREIGYEGVELAGLGPIEPAHLARLLRDAGLDASSAHVGWERLRDETEAVLEDSRRWGCDHLAIPTLPRAYRDAAGYARFGAEAGEVAGRLRSAGIWLSYHNHSFELERFGSESGLELLFEASVQFWAPRSTPTGSSMAAAAQRVGSGGLAAGCPPYTLKTWLWWMANRRWRRLARATSTGRTCSSRARSQGRSC